MFWKWQDKLRNACAVRWDYERIYGKRIGEITWNCPLKYAFALHLSFKTKDPLRTNGCYITVHTETV